MLEKLKKKKILVFIAVFILLFMCYCNSRLTMLNLPEGKYISELESPNKEYILKSYRYSGGATMDWTLRVEVVDNATNKKWNIYYVYHESEAEMK